MEIKFITLNIEHGGKLMDSILDFLLRENPDILVLQEVYDGHDKNLEKRYRTMEEFKRLFGERLPYNTFGATINDTAVNVKWGNAIFSKFPIKSSRTIFFDLPFTNYNFTLDPDPRDAAEGMQEAELDVNGKSLFVYSWHGVWNNHGGDTKERIIMGEKIIESLRDKKTFILAGDTNMNPTSGVIKNICKTLDAESVFGESLKTTFNVRRKEFIGNYDKSPVDMIFISKDIKVLDKKMPEVDISDHFPLVCELEV